MTLHRPRSQILVLAFLFCCVASFSALSKKVAPAVKLTGMFSDLTYNTEGGDLLGEEIFVVTTNKGYQVIYQQSEGEPQVPVVVPATMMGHALSFTVPAEVSGVGTFTGTVHAHDLTGTFSGSGMKVRLVRKNSYWQ
jgi:hypothetical protein